MATKSTVNKKEAKAPAKKRPSKKTAQNNGNAWQVVFLEELAKGGNVTLAARKSSVDRSWAYKYREEDREFAEKWESALAESADLMEAEALRRAVEGVRKPIYQGGFLVGHVQEYSDTLLIFMLKGAKPEKYRERHEHSGPAGGAIPIALSDLIDKAYGDDNDKPELDKSD